MELKDYQRRVMDEVDLYLRALAKEQAAGNRRHAAADAWRSPDVRHLELGRYEDRQNGIGEDLPTFCIKVPTGGGKTLLATQILGSIHRTILTEHRGAGLVLWVVPSSQIYRDTLKRLRDRKDMYRLMLEHALSRRIEMWEKTDIARLTPGQLRDCLNILVVQLASTNRELKEQLKFFKDSGGNIVQHFPPESDYEAHRKLKEQVPNLEMLAEDADSGQFIAKTSIGNLVRLCKPAVILDEGHKATSQKARETIEGFNASAVVELSATPHKGANVLCKVSGQELLAEQMIKLPLNVATSGLSDWKAVLTKAKDKRQVLAAKAAEYAGSAGESRWIRPIVLVQVERTGKEQRGAKIKGQQAIHAKDVEEYLIQRLSVPKDAIRIKSAEDDGLEDVDLLDSGCPVEWIITKSALQEGWDCPFAYILVSLNNTTNVRSITQLVGRILRQPYQERTSFPELNESYVYCLHQTAGEISKQVKGALEKEGYEGEAESLVVDASGKPPQRTERIISIWPEIAAMYTRPFEGQIYLPRFCVKEGKSSLSLDYFEHLISQVDVTNFQYDKIEWPLAEALSEAKDHYFRISLGTELARQYEIGIEVLENDEQVLAWMTANLRFDYLSFKQLRTVVRKVYERLIQSPSSCMVKDRLTLVKTEVREKIESFVQGEIDRETEAAFGRLFDDGKIHFYLECSECRFRIPPSITLYSIGPLSRLTHDDGSDVTRSLFDFAERESQNEYERKVALCLDKHADVLWWFRNRVGPEFFAVQGYRKQRIYPDFVVQSKQNGRKYHRVLVVEAKGAHLEGHPDTTYKRNVASYFEKAGRKVTWQQLGQDFKDHVFRFQILDQAQEHGRDWQDELNDFLVAHD